MGAVDEFAHVSGLVHSRRGRFLALSSGAWPAGFADQDVLAREVLADVAPRFGDVGECELDIHGLVLPEGQDMDGYEIDFGREAVVARPEFPDVGIGDRDFRALPGVADERAHLVLGALAAQQYLVADDERAHDVGVGVGQRNRVFKLARVERLFISDPGAKQHLHAERTSKLGHLVEALGNRVQAHAVGDLRQRGEVGGDLFALDAGVLDQRSLAGAVIRCVGHAAQLLAVGEVQVVHGHRARLLPQHGGEQQQHGDAGDEQGEPELAAVGAWSEDHRVRFLPGSGGGGGAG